MIFSLRLRVNRLLLLGLLSLGLTTVGHAATPAPELDWLELMPPEDQQALEDMPEITHQTPEGQGFSDQRQLQQVKGLPEVMYSAKTVAALNGQRVRLGGYPVPLETDAKGRVTQLFLVPYPGACVHVPPPPPNQIVLVRYAKGIELDDIYTPLWVEGPLSVQSTRNALADAAYSLNASDIRPIGEEGF